jgi:Holliday junction resolvase-like predicted endonuclease
MEPYHVSISAEAFAAAQFARAGCDVSVQYGANQPEYDLLIKRGNQFKMISVKGSQKGGWGLVQSYKKGRTYHQAIDAWAADQNQLIVYCLVGFNELEFNQIPRMYLASIIDLTNELKAQRRGEGTTSLTENYTYTNGKLKGWTDRIPDAWLFTEERVNSFLHRAA